MHNTVTLAACPVGLFFSGNTLCVKTEYANSDGRVVAYIVESGEFFWGGTSRGEDQCQLPVHPVGADALMALGEASQFIETRDVSAIGALVAEAANQVSWVGKGATATVRFAVDDQWYSAGVRMIDESEGRA